MYIVVNMHTSYLIEYSSPVIHIPVANCTSSSEGFQLKMLWLLLSFTGKILMQKNEYRFHCCYYCR